MKENRRIAAFRCIGILTLGTFRLSRICSGFARRPNASGQSIHRVPRGANFPVERGERHNEGHPAKDQLGQEKVRQHYTFQDRDAATGYLSP
jgi:hypothetical protein